MKAVAVFMVLAVAIQLAHADHANHLKEDLVANYVTRALGDKIKALLEDLKEIMKTGNEEMGIPKMDPLDVKHQNIDVDEDLISAQGAVDDLHLEGLSDYTVQHADFKIAKWNLSIDLLWSDIKGKTSYDIDAKLANKIPVYGKGDVSFELKNFNFATDAKLKVDLKNKKISIVSFSNTKILLEKLNLEITGLYNNDELSQFLGAVVGDIVPEGLVDFQDEITAQVNKILLKLGNEILEKINFEDIWGIIKP